MDSIGKSGKEPIWLARVVRDGNRDVTLPMGRYAIAATSLACTAHSNPYRIHNTWNRNRPIYPIDLEHLASRLMRHVGMSESFWESSLTIRINTWSSPSTSQATLYKEPMRGDRDEIWYRAAADPEAFGLIQGGMGSMAEHGLLDPVVEGIISPGLADIAYQV